MPAEPERRPAGHRSLIEVTRKDRENGQTAVERKMTRFHRHPPGLPPGCSVTASRIKENEMGEEIARQIAIVGAGSLGQAFAGLLTASGQPVTLLTSPRTAARLGQAGRIRLRGAVTADVPVACSRTMCWARHSGQRGWLAR
jgi:phosphoglycerate dehydrogenase-like enzyme